MEIVAETLRRQRAEVEAYMEREVGALEWGGVVSDPSESTDSEGSEIDLEPRERWEDGPVAVRRRLGQESYQEGQRSRGSGSDEGVYQRTHGVATLLSQEVAGSGKRRMQPRRTGFGSSAKDRRPNHSGGDSSERRSP